MGPFFYILLGVGVATLVGVVISRVNQRARARKQAREAVVGGANVTNDITRVGVGGVLRLPPFGRSAAPIETYVEHRHRYDEEGEAPWYELICVHGKRELLIEWERRAAALHVTGGFEDENPSLSDLGLSEQDMIALDEGERTSFRWDGVEWRLAESGERRYYEDDGQRAEGYYGWDFQAPGGDRFVSIEKWADEPDFDVYHLWRIDASAVEIYDAGKSR